MGHHATYEAALQGHDRFSTVPQFFQNQSTRKGGNAKSQYGPVYEAALQGHDRFSMMPQYPKPQNAPSPRTGQKLQAAPSPPRKQRPPTYRTPAPSPYRKQGPLTYKSPAFIGPYSNQQQPAPRPPMQPSRTYQPNQPVKNSHAYDSRVPHTRSVYTCVPERSCIGHSQHQFSEEGNRDLLGGGRAYCYRCAQYFSEKRSRASQPREESSGCC